MISRIFLQVESIVGNSDKSRKSIINKTACGGIDPNWIWASSRTSNVGTGVGSGKLGSAKIKYKVNTEENRERKGKEQKRK